MSKQSAEQKRKYIVNLTNDIAFKGNLWITYGRLRKQKTLFVNQVAEELLRGGEVIRNASGETLGRIMVSLETGDVMANKEEMLLGVPFTGEPGETLREIVARCLAFAIWERFQAPESVTNLPPFNFKNTERETV